MGDVILRKEPKIFTDKIEGSSIGVRCLSQDESVFSTLQLLEERNLPLPRLDLADKLLVGKDGSKNIEVCSAIYKTYKIVDFWCGPFLAYNPPNTKIGEVIERIYPDGKKRRIITPEDIRGEANLILSSRDGLIPGKDFSYKMKNGVLELEFDPKDFITHKLPVDNTMYIPGLHPTNEVTGLPDPNGKGPKREVRFWRGNSAVSLVVRGINSHDYLNLNESEYYFTKAVLEFTQED